MNYQVELQFYNPVTRDRWPAFNIRMYKSLRWAMKYVIGVMEMSRINYNEDAYKLTANIRYANREPYEVGSLYLYIYPNDTTSITILFMDRSGEHMVIEEPVTTANDFIAFYKAFENSRFPV